MSFAQATFHFLCIITELLQSPDLLLGSYFIIPVCNSSMVCCFILSALRKLSCSDAASRHRYSRTTIICVQIQLLKDEEAKLGVQTRPNRPRALILGPTRELADQILRVAKSLSHYARFRSACVTGGMPVHAFGKHFLTIFPISSCFQKRDPLGLCESPTPYGT